MKTLTIILVLALPATTFAQQSIYYTDRNGLPAGQAWTYGNQTFYSDAIGRPMGSAATNGPLPPQPLGMPIVVQPLEPLRFNPIRPSNPFNR